VKNQAQGLRRFARSGKRVTLTTDPKSYRLYIDGEWVDASSDDEVAVINPAAEADAVCAYEPAPRVHAGTVSINGGGGGPNPWGPFGGNKHSGIGREFGDYGLLEYTQLKTVSWSAGRP